MAVNQIEIIAALRSYASFILTSLQAQWGLLTYHYHLSLPLWFCDIRSTTKKSKVFQQSVYILSSIFHNKFSMQNSLKFLQRRLYSFLNTWWGFSYFLLLCFLLLWVAVNRWNDSFGYENMWVVTIDANFPVMQFLCYFTPFKWFVGMAGVS